MLNAVLMQVTLGAAEQFGLEERDVHVSQRLLEFFRLFVSVKLICLCAEIEYQVRYSKHILVSQ